MFRIDGPGSLAGHWTAGDPTAIPPIPATKFTRDWFEDLQESLIACVVDSGQTPIKLDFTQISKSARILGSDHGSGKASKNLIDNSNFWLNQRGFSSIFHGTRFVMDRWWFNANHGSTNCTTVTHNVDANAAPGPGSLASEDSGGYDYMEWAQTVNGAGLSSFEQRNLELLLSLNGQTVTVSFYAKLIGGSGNVIVIPEFEQHTGSNVVTTGPNLTVNSTTWARFQWTVTLPSFNPSTLGISDYLATRFKLPAGATFDIAFSNIQLELGNVATGYAHPGCASDLLECSRYFWKSYKRTVSPGAVSALGQLSGYDAGTDGTSLQARFAVRMRAIPTITWYSPSAGTTPKADRGGAAQTVSSTVGTTDASTGYPVTSSQSAGSVFAHATAEAEL